MEMQTATMETQTATLKTQTADYAPPSVTAVNVMEVIANGNRRILATEGKAIMDLAQMTESDSTAACALIEWITTAKQKNGITFQNIRPPLAKMLDLYQLGDIINPFCE